MTCRAMCVKAGVVVVSVDYRLYVFVEKTSLRENTDAVKVHPNTLSLEALKTLGKL